MTDDTEILWHLEQIAKNRAILEQLEAGNTARGEVFPETQSEIQPEGSDFPIGVDRGRIREDGLIDAAQ